MASVSTKSKSAGNTESTEIKPMTILDFLNNPYDKTQFDVLTIIGINKRVFADKVFEIFNDSNFDNSTCKEIRENILKDYMTGACKNNCIYQNYYREDGAETEKRETNASYNTRKYPIYNNRKDVVDTILNQMRSNRFCINKLLLLKDVIKFEYRATGYGNDNPNKIELKIWCFVNEDD